MLAPVVAVVTTIDREHLDQYTSLEDIQGAFIQFVNRVPFDGAAILCIDEPNVQAIIPSVKRPIITYGTSSQADLVISDVKLEGLESEFRLTYRGEDLGLFRLTHPPGIHNVRNAAAAAAVALYLDVPADLIREGLGIAQLRLPPRRCGHCECQEDASAGISRDLRPCRSAGTRSPILPASHR